MKYYETYMMDDLDVLLQDLEATIPSNTNQQANNELNDEFIQDLDSKMGLFLPNKSDSFSSLQPVENPNSNISELDLLLKDLEITEDLEPASDNLKKSISNLSSVDKTSGGGDVSAGGGKLSTSASNAAQQLDDLMDSLTNFHANVHRGSATSDQSEPSYAKPDKRPSKTPKLPPSNPDDGFYASVRAPMEEKKGGGDLDEMLNSMNTNLVKQGIRAASKGLCGACGKPVMGEVTTALGQVWHPEHFVCVVCDNEIGTSTFFEREGKPYCEVDYHRLFAPTCAYCNDPVLGQCVTALNKTWHPEHFFCAMCDNFFGDEGFHEFEGKPYCRADYYNMFAPKCGGCSKPILTNYISALDTKWHPECFVCRECMAPFTHGSFFELEGQPYCETHYHARRGSLCAGCQKPITSRCISAMGKKFHQEHFVCAFCLKQLNKGTFKEQNEKPYCHQCFVKLFGKVN